jgi:peptide/nickel transport system ATP-binding protein
VQEVLARPKHPYTRALLDCEIDDDGKGRLVSIPGEVPDPVSELRTCVFAPRCAHAVDRCLARVPPLDTIGPHHMSACIRAHEVLP